MEVLNSLVCAVAFRLCAVADCDTEAEFTHAVKELQDCVEWQESSDLHAWFEDTWLSEKEVQFCPLS